MSNTTTTTKKEKKSKAAVAETEQQPLIQIATEADMPGTAEEKKNTVEITEEQQRDPEFDLIAAAPPEEKNQFFAVLEQEMRALYARGDAVIGLRIRPGSLETFMEWYSTFQFDPQNPQIDAQIRAQIQIKPDAAVPSVHVETYSQMENGWLVEHYSKQGLFEYINSGLNSPVRLTPQDLRLLFAIECLTDVMQANAKKPSIVTAHGGAAVGGKFDPSQLNLKIKR